MATKTKMISRYTITEDTPTLLGQPPNLRNGLKKFPIGVSKRNGGTCFIEPYGNSWEVREYKGWWIGRLSWYIKGEESVGFIAICQTRDRFELAVDAFLDFIDRLRESRIPRTVEEPATLMDMCMWSARRQR